MTLCAIPLFMTIPIKCNALPWLVEIAFSQWMNINCKPSNMDYLPFLFAKRQNRCGQNAHFDNHGGWWKTLPINWMKWHGHDAIAFSQWIKINVKTSNRAELPFLFVICFHFVVRSKSGLQCTPFECALLCCSASTTLHCIIKGMTLQMRVRNGPHNKREKKEERSELVIFVVKSLLWTGK